MTQLAAKQIREIVEPPARLLGNSGGEQPECPRLKSLLAQAGCDFIRWESDDVG
jgi:hypothetical protein